MNPIGFAKSHPVAVGVGVIGLAIVLFLALGPDGDVIDGGAVSTSSDVGTGTALQQYQAQMQAQAMMVGAQKEIALAEQATALKVAELSFNSRAQEISAQKELGLASLDTTYKVSTLQSALESHKISAEVENKRTEQAMLSTQLQNSLETMKLAFASQTEQAKIAAQPKGLFSWLFG